jgi:hypothetical protein
MTMILAVVASIVFRLPVPVHYLLLCIRMSHNKYSNSTGKGSATGLDRNREPIANRKPDQLDVIHSHGDGLVEHRWVVDTNIEYRYIQYEYGDAVPLTDTTTSERTVCEGNKGRVHSLFSR